jgi:hypothetical protein
MLQIEWAIVRAASTGVRAIFAAPALEAQSYTERNMLGMLGLVLAVGALSEIPLHHLFVPGKDWLLAVGFDFGVVYCAIWVLGVYGMMTQRPHELRGDTLVFHRGPFAHVQVARDCIQSAEVITEESRDAKRKYTDAYYMGVPGASLVHIVLKEPARVALTYPLRLERTVRELLVPSDRPGELAARLRSRSFDTSG